MPNATVRAKPELCLVTPEPSRQDWNSTPPIRDGSPREQLRLSPAETMQDEVRDRVFAAEREAETRLINTRAPTAGQSFKSCSLSSTSSRERQCCPLTRFVAQGRKRSQKAANPFWIGHRLPGPRKPPGPPHSKTRPKLLTIYNLLQRGYEDRRPLPEMAPESR